jgi:transposase
MEATGVYSRSVAVHLLSHEGIEISIVNPAQIKSFSRSQLRRVKTDNVDAEVIRQFAQSQNPRSWQPRPKIEGQLYQLVCQRDHVLQKLLELENRNHSLSYDPDLPEEVKRSQRTLMRCYKRQIATLEDRNT